MNFGKMKWLCQSAMVIGTLCLSTIVSLQSPVKSNNSPSAQVPVTRTSTPFQSKSVIYVNSATGADSEVSGKSEDAPYRTITYALDKAQPGTVIQIASGSYTSASGEVFPLVIKPDVSLRGDESSKGLNTVITGGGRHISPTFARQDVAVLVEKDCTITGVTITNPNTRGTALWIEYGSPTIKNNTFTNSNREGIFITATAAPTIEANVFTKNSGNGISVARSAKGEIRNNVFQETGFGLAISGTSSPLVIDNQIIQNRVGIIISEEARPVIHYNFFKNNQQGDVIIATVSQAQPELGTN
jgi:parallel beta-helix repeat protein